MTTRLKQILIPLAFAATVLAGPTSMGQAATSVPVLSDKSAVGELTYWNSIKESGVADDYRTYLENFPNGMFVDPAMERYEKSGGAKSDLSPDVISASLNATAEPAIAEDAVTADAPVVVPKPVQRKKIAKVRKKQAVAVKSKKKSVKTVRAKQNKKCVAGSIYENKCVAAAKTKKVKPPKQKIIAGGDTSSGGGSSSSGGGNSGGGNGWGG